VHQQRHWYGTRVAPVRSVRWSLRRPAPDDLAVLRCPWTCSSLSAANFLLAAHDQGILCATLGHSPFFPRRLVLREESGHLHCALFDFCGRCCLVLSCAQAACCALRLWLPALPALPCTAWSFACPLVSLRPSRPPTSRRHQHPQSTTVNRCGRGSPPLGLIFGRTSHADIFVATVIACAVG